MDYTFEQLKGMTVAQLRDIAQETNAVQGSSQMRKDQLLPALCEAFEIDMHAHHKIVGINKGEIKGKIKALKAKRDAALEASDSKQLKKIRRDIHKLKRKIHKATV